MVATSSASTGEAEIVPSFLASVVAVNGGVGISTVAVLLLLIDVAVIELSVILLKFWSERNPATDERHPGWYAGMYGVCVVVYWLSGLMRHRVMRRGAASALAALHTRLLHAVLHAPLRHFSQSCAGQLLSTFSDTLLCVEADAFLPSELGILGSGFGLFIVSVSVYELPWLGLPLGAGMAGVVLTVRSAGREARALSRQELALRVPVLDFLQESFAGGTTVRASGE